MQKLLQDMLDKLVELIHECGYDVHDWQVVTVQEKAELEKE